MAKISAKKSDLKTIANKIIVSPSTAAVSDLKFKRKKDFKTFVKWIESSNKALAGIKLPSKKEIDRFLNDTVSRLERNFINNSLTLIDDKITTILNLLKNK